MGIMDRLNEFCDAESVAAAAGTSLLGSVIDLGDAGVGDQGHGGMVFNLMCSTSIITGGVAGTIQFFLVSDAQAAIATDGSASVHWESKAFVTDDDSLNDLDTGDTIAQFRLPYDGAVPYERYLGVLATIATTTVTAGAVDAWLSLDPVNGFKALPDGVN